MGLTEVQAKIFGESAEREYTFIVDTAAMYMALPLVEIEALGLRPTGATVRLMSATGLVDVETYFATAELRGQMFGGIAVPSSSFLLGYQLLQNMRFRVNPVTHDIEKVPDDEIHPPFL